MSYIIYISAAIILSICGGYLLFLFGEWLEKIPRESIKQFPKNIISFYKTAPQKLISSAIPNNVICNYNNITKSEDFPYREKVEVLTRLSGLNYLDESFFEEHGEKKEDSYNSLTPKYKYDNLAEEI